MQKKGMVWVIGSSGGLGRAAAQAFAQNGWSVIAGARSFAAGTSPLGEGVTVLPLDVTNDESCTAFTEKALGMENRVDVLVCAAAQLVLGSCENTTVDELDRLLDVNVLGAVRMIQRALPLMRAQKSGKIILFSSINGLLGIPFQSAYTASKHAHLRHYSSRRRKRPLSGPAGPENRAERPATAYALPSEGRQARPAPGRAFAYPSSRQPESENSLFLLSCSSLRQVSEGTF